MEEEEEELNNDNRQVNFVHLHIEKLNLCLSETTVLLSEFIFTLCNLLLLLAKIMDARTINSQIIQLSLVTGQPETQNSYLSPSSERTMLNHYHSTLW